MDNYHTADELPPEWDALAGGNYALKRDFLRVMERANPCEQRYYGFRDADGRLDSILMTLVQERLNLLMFTPVTWRLRMTLVYVPISASTAGMVCGEATRPQVEAFLAGMRGITLVLNQPEASALPGFARTATCPRIRMKLRWASFHDYLHDLRSNYRYRYKKAAQKGASLTFRRLANTGDFTERHYTLYEQVFNKSRIQVEKLSLDYFRECPATLLVFENNSEPVGFVQLLDNGPELIFGFVGVDYAVNEQFDIYHNLMLKMVEYGIEHGYTTIDLGQTADETKLKLGGEYEYLCACLRHHHPLVNWLLARLLPRIGYQPIRQHFHVLKSSTDQIGEPHEYPAHTTQTA